jgi:hypothetical protein
VRNSGSDVIGNVARSRESSGGVYEVLRGLTKEKISEWRKRSAGSSLRLGCISALTSGMQHVRAHVIRNAAAIVNDLHLNEPVAFPVRADGHAAAAELDSLERAGASKPLSGVNRLAKKMLAARERCADSPYEFSRHLQRRLCHACKRGGRERWTTRTKRV